MKSHPHRSYHPVHTCHTCRLLAVLLCAGVLCAAVILTGCTRDVTDQEITLTLSAADGSGTYEKTGTYTGTLSGKLPEGEGTFTARNEDGLTWVYTGSFVGGHFSGAGRIEWSNGAYEEGTYADDVITEGTFVFAEGSFTGTFVADEFDEGTLTWRDGSSFTGDMKGKGTFTDAQGVSSEAEWVDGSLVTESSLTSASTVQGVPAEGDSAQESPADAEGDS